MVTVGARVFVKPDGVDVVTMLIFVDIRVSNCEELFDGTADSVFLAGREGFLEAKQPGRVPRAASILH